MFNSLGPASNDLTTGWEVSSFLVAQVKAVGQMSAFLVSGCSVHALIPGVVGLEGEAEGETHRGVKRVI